VAHDLHIFRDRKGRLAASATRPNGTRSRPVVLSSRATQAVYVLSVAVAGKDGRAWIDDDVMPADELACACEALVERLKSGRSDV